MNKLIGTIVFISLSYYISAQELKFTLATSDSVYLMGEQVIFIGELLNIGNSDIVIGHVQPYLANGFLITLVRDEYGQQLMEKRNPAQWPSTKNSTLLLKSGQSHSFFGYLTNYYYNEYNPDELINNPYGYIKPGMYTVELIYQHNDTQNPTKEPVLIHSNICRFQVEAPASHYDKKAYKAFIDAVYYYNEANAFNPERYKEKLLALIKEYPESRYAVHAYSHLLDCMISSFDPRLETTVSAMLIKYPNEFSTYNIVRRLIGYKDTFFERVEVKNLIKTTRVFQWAIKFGDIKK